MKKLISLLLILVFISSACAQKQVSYIIYTESSLTEYDSLASDTKENVSFERLNERDFDFVTETEVTNSKAPSKKEVNIGQNNFSMALKKSYITAISECENEKLAYIGKIDRYETADRGVEAHFRQDTKELVFFLNYNLEKSADTLTDEEAKELADKLFISLYGEDKLREYTHTRISNDNTENSVTYFRYVHGYETNDTVSIKFNKHGELYSLNANRMGTFEDAEEVISKVDIEKAVKVLTDTIGDEWTPTHHFLTIDSTGNYFIAIGALNGDYAERFYININ